LILIGLVWFAGLALVTAAQFELDSIDDDATDVSTALANVGDALPVAKRDASRPAE
jgi:hypothetical protein